MAWQLLEYERALSDFRESCEESLRPVIDRKADLLSEHGILLRRPHSEAIKGVRNLFELIIKQKSKGPIARILYCFLPHNRVVFLLAAYKDQRKLPKAVLEKAVQIKEWIEANEGQDLWQRLHQLN